MSRSPSLSSVKLVVAGVWFLCFVNAQPAPRPDRTFYMDNSAQHCGDRFYYIYNEMNTVQLWNPSKLDAVQRTNADECLLKFEALPNTRAHKLQITFPDLVNMPCDIGVKLNFYDQDGVGTDKILKSFCGTFRPHGFFTSGSFLTIKMTRIAVPATVSDISFKFQVSRLPEDTDPSGGISPFYMDNEREQCSQTHEIQDGIQYRVEAWIGSIDRNKPANEKCMLTFKSKYETKKLRVHFTQFIFPCVMGQAVLFFYDSRDQTAEMRRYTCRSRVPAGLMTSGQYLTVVLDHRASVQFDFSFYVSVVDDETAMTTLPSPPGYASLYFSLQSDCDRQFSITSSSQYRLYAWAPGNRTDALAPQTCSVTFHAQPEHVLYVHFEELSMPCDNRPYLKFYDGEDKSKVLMDIFCSSVPPEDFRTTKQYLTIELERRSNTALDFDVLITQETAESGGLSGGVVAAIVILLLAVLAAIVVAVVIILRRRKTKRDNPTSDNGDATGEGLLAMVAPPGENGQSDGVPMKDMTRS